MVKFSFDVFLVVDFALAMLHILYFWLFFFVRMRVCVCDDHVQNEQEQ